MGTCLLQLSNVFRHYAAGEQQLTVLRGIDLCIERGEMVAVVGASGSGKSTLMNILGCLDKPSAGTYQINAKDTASMSPDELAQLRREHFGFIFQRYHLLNDLTALANAEMPAIYAGERPQQRKQRARALLSRLGLAERLQHKPGELSGGQQQRVSIARALINGGEIILADEPTGALDRHSGQEMMGLLQEFHREGHTIIIVTHDRKVAEHADRIIEIEDGAIVADHLIRRNQSGRVAPSPEKKPRQASLTTFIETLQMALLAMSTHRLRTLLTMLGIIIGIASVVSVVALGQGSSKAVLDNINSLGTNSIDVRPGRGFGDRRSQRVQTLVAEDAQAVAKLPFVEAVTPENSVALSVRYGNQNVNARIEGVGQDYFQVRGYKIAEGHTWGARSVATNAQEAVIDINTKKALFSDSPALHKIILVGKLPVKIVGVTQPRESAFGNSDSLKIWLPYTTLATRISGQHSLDALTVRIREGTASSAAEQAIIALIKMRHGSEDFFTINTDTIRKNIEKTTGTMTLMVSAIAVISLIVGGIGVMNIMLVSVTERTQEIGVRMAVGARQTDIMKQFLTEAVIVCLLGGILGILLAFSIGVLFSTFGTHFSMIYSFSSIAAAFTCATVIGIVFGFIPARNAARLDPVLALSRPY
ncbi:macrolide transport system ATP-binding/permease protein [Alteromonadaceae bacterium 2753L.S.0a.02]|nr:macrolide transport system ATP-binding/permease protein [Alteromonadaceae bacterium 2753L.S.0a.02]